SWTRADHSRSWIFPEQRIHAPLTSTTQASLPAHLPTLRACSTECLAAPTALLALIFPEPRQHLVWALIMLEQSLAHSLTAPGIRMPSSSVAKLLLNSIFPAGMTLQPSPSTTAMRLWVALPTLPACRMPSHCSAASSPSLILQDPSIRWRLVSASRAM